MILMQEQKSGENKWQIRRRQKKAKNKEINRDSRNLLEAIGKMKIGILNESTVGDEKGNLTYTGGLDESVINYKI